MAGCLTEISVVLEKWGIAEVLALRDEVACVYAERLLNGMVDDCEIMLGLIWQGKLPARCVRAAASPWCSCSDLRWTVRPL